MNFTTVIPGLPGGPLTTSYPIFINLVPASHTRQRPGIKAKKPRRCVQHGSGNPKSTAKGEIAYIVGGADGRQASYHYSTDWQEAWVGVPLDEVTYQAADSGGPGNMNGVSNEMAENKAAWADPAKRARMIYIAADLMGRSAARLDIAKPEYHWDFNYVVSPANRHHCPDFILFAADHVATKAAYERQWHASKADELARMHGGTPMPDPEPVPVPTNLAKVLFGTAGGYKFDPDGPVSKLWLETGNKNGRFPQLVDVSVNGTLKYFVFGDGSVIVSEEGKPLTWLTEIKAA